MKSIVNGLCIALGFIFLGIGILGVILPVLPTTPFLMAAAFFFAKGSRRFHRWFAATGLYIKYVEPALGQKAMEKDAKKKAMLTLLVIFAISFLVVPVWQAKVAILAVALFHFYYFVFKIKTVRRENPGDHEVIEDVS